MYAEGVKWHMVIEHSLSTSWNFLGIKNITYEQYAGTGLL